MMNFKIIKRANVLKKRYLFQFQYLEIILYQLAIALQGVTQLETHEPSFTKLNYTLVSC